jgi:four helix bundle protein
MEKGFERLAAWADAKQLAVSVYKGCRTQPLRHEWSLRDQMQRAVISISSNIAEGFERDSVRDEIRYLVIAKGSAAELRSQVAVGMEIGLIERALGEKWINDCRKVGAALANLIKFKRRVLSSGGTNRRQPEE